ncbi:hypothetical protein QVD17_20118 [Tagetes erecta]|uniref:Uncharacterized protein n=1 Tax=Tagetes erecta TaxID=13708 RepID=A0AAD8KS95_TARER|nr:hypothetical protein QVD17_20118 [Tagetes erecta]
MADVNVRGHDGDGHGDPPPGGLTPLRVVLRLIRSSNKRRKTTNKGLRKQWEKNGSKPFLIVFYFEDQQTMRPVGDNSSDFVNLVGVTIRTTVPLNYKSWKDVPSEAMTTIWPQLETYFNLRPYLDHPGYKTPFEAGIMKLCSELYSGAKSRFKKKHFTILGGLGNRDAILRKIPEGLTPEMWNEMLIVKSWGSLPSGPMAWGVGKSL